MQQTESKPAKSGYPNVQKGELGDLPMTRKQLDATHNRNCQAYNIVDGTCFDYKKSKKGRFCTAYRGYLATEK